MELKISKRRVNQIWKEYCERGEIPEMGKNIGRPKKEIREEERKIVKEAKKKYKLGARRLEPIIDRDYRVHIPHNRIHRILLEEGAGERGSEEKEEKKMGKVREKTQFECGTHGLA